MNKIDLQELYYLLMSSWIYSIEKTRDELLGDNIAYTRRLGWNATRFVMDHLENSCGFSVDAEGKPPIEIMKSIVECLEDAGFIKKGTVTVKDEGNRKMSISVTKCRAAACKDLIKKGVAPHVCLRSIILANFLENLTHEQFSYHLDADPEGQPRGVCTSYLCDVS
ncbi:hypothetical protein [uncultured Methanobacterium sp.]|uniref:hypothetical protein n=1 Tax=uncultured Methanobacterium sp. TaxID=176306 RepID=UPI002AA84F43|nr:hypothetical protein [uncultured Methanobacterium sp.]